MPGDNADTIYIALSLERVRERSERG